MAQFQSQSPPPLRHPVPTHPAYIPEPPSTPISPQGYQRYSSSPGPQQNSAPAMQGYVPGHVPAYTSPFAHNQPQNPMHDNAGYHSSHHGPSGNMAVANDANAGGSMGNIPPPDFGAWGIDGTTAQLGMQLGHSAVAAGQEYMQRNVSTALTCPRPKFNGLSVWHTFPIY
jgi:hypothetical protein